MAPGKYLASLVDGVGIAQHRLGDRIITSDTVRAYSLDDAARAAPVLLNLGRSDLAGTLLKFVGASFSDGIWRAYGNLDGTFDPESASANGLAMVIYGMGKLLTCGFREHDARPLYHAARESLGAATDCRAIAYALMGACQLDPPWADKLAWNLMEMVGDTDPEWRWPREDGPLGYMPGLLSEGLACYALLTGSQHAHDLSRWQLEWLDQQCRINGIVAPIGNDGWWWRGEAKPSFGQQPEGAASLVKAWGALYDVTGRQSDLDRAGECFQWFHGGNVGGLVVADSDGRTADGIDGHEGDLSSAYLSPHAGAESAIVFEEARQRMGLRA